MKPIAQLRCFNHEGREAVARCPQCGRTFCRECITEYKERILCAQCLAALSPKAQGRKTPASAILRGAWLLVSFLFLWAFYYYLGKALLLLPSAFHKAIK